MIDLFKETQSDDLPEFIGVTDEQVGRYWDEWLVYRGTGRRNHAGGFESSLSFLQAITDIPEEMFKVFLELDSVYGKMERQYIKQTAGKDK